MSGAGAHLEPSPLEPLLRHSASPCTAGNQVHPSEPCPSTLPSEYPAKIHTASLQRFFLDEAKILCGADSRPRQVYLDDNPDFHEAAAPLAFTTLSCASVRLCP